MKIILSRKGFDASSGGVPSPILLPHHELYSIPIPEPSAYGRTRYRDIRTGNQTLGTIVHDLTHGHITPLSIAHLDPDLNHQSLPRLDDWRPMFGQAGAAERHLQTQQVQAGDLFLFYGWFREVEYVGGSYRYKVKAPDIHAIFGWLQIERRLTVDDLTCLPLWTRDHPHCKPQKYAKLDNLYIATEQLALPGLVDKRPGGGVFSHFRSTLQLTAPGQSRSVWKLPYWFYPILAQPGLTYHHNRTRWQRQVDYVELRTVGRGQEFVLDSQTYPEAIEWVADIFNDNI